MAGLWVIPDRRPARRFTDVFTDVMRSPTHTAATGARLPVAGAGRARRLRGGRGARGRDAGGVEGACAILSGIIILGKVDGGV